MQLWRCVLLENNVESPGEKCSCEENRQQSTDAWCYQLYVISITVTKKGKVKKRNSTQHTYRLWRSCEGVIDACFLSAERACYLPKWVQWHWDTKLKGGGNLIMVVCHLMTGICSGGCGRQFVIQISECTYTNLDSCDITRQYNLTKWLSYIQAAIEQNVVLWCVSVGKLS